MGLNSPFKGLIFCATLGDHSDFLLPQLRQTHLLQSITFYLTYLAHGAQAGNRFSATQEILRILWNANVHYRTHKCTSYYMSPISVPFNFIPKIYSIRNTNYGSRDDLGNELGCRISFTRTKFILYELKNYLVRKKLFLKTTYHMIHGTYNIKIGKKNLFIIRSID